MKMIDNQVSGLVIDCLSILDPEMVKVNPIMQRQLLFSKNGSSDEKCTSAYMTCMLAHQTQNCTLEECFAWMLSHVKDADRYYLCACACITYVHVLMSNCYNKPIIISKVNCF